MLFQTLMDPCAQNKRSIIKIIKDINQHLHQDGNEPYFCNRCNFKHKKGKIYEEHKIFGEIPFVFPDIVPIKVEKRYLIKIVGIYGLGTGNICEDIKKGERLRVKLLKSGTITIYYGRYKIGYVNQLQTELVEEIIQNQNSSTYYEFRRYIPAQYITKSKRIPLYKHKYYKAPYGQMFIYSLNTEKLNDVIEGLIELHELGHPHVEYSMIYFPTSAVRYFEMIATNLGYHDLVHKIIKFKHNRGFKTEYGTLLL